MLMHTGGGLTSRRYSVRACLRLKTASFSQQFLDRVSCLPPARSSPLLSSFGSRTHAAPGGGCTGAPGSAPRALNPTDCDTKRGSCRPLERRSHAMDGASRSRSGRVQRPRLGPAPGYAVGGSFRLPRAVEASAAGGGCGAGSCGSGSLGSSRMSMPISLTLET